MEFKGTKGKWITKSGDVYSDQQEDNPHKNPICDVYYWSDQEGQANTLLISKAPEMLEMLKYCLELFGEYGLPSHQYDKVIKVIKEATELK